jgi:RNA polymerase sigma-70 factor (ECF subfamily)
VTEHTDAQLVASCRAGDEQAWQLLVARYARYVYAIAAQAFRLPVHDAEDVFQDVFARVYERLGTLRDPGALRPWIAQLTRNACVDRLRTSGREQLGDQLEEAADDELERLDEAFAVRQALERLAPECREVLDRFFCRDESYRTIGAALSLPSGTIASRISRCLGKLRREIEGRSEPLTASGEQVAR